MSFINTYVSNNFIMSTQENSDEEIQAWLDQVHYGSCCSDDVEDCQDEKIQLEEEPSEEDSEETSS